MKKQLLICLSLALLAGCTAKSTPTYTPDPAPPKGVVKLLTDNDGSVWADLRTISAYNGNPNLRQFYMLSSYKPHVLEMKKLHISIRSSRVITVINCTTHERARFERVAFTQPFAQGEVIVITQEIGQWESYPQNSPLGLVGGMVCKIPADRLKPAPARETRKPLLG